MHAVNYLIEGNDKYIRRYPESDLVKILKDSGYHSEEWEETDEEEVQPEDGKEAKSTSIYIYERWWRSSEVFIILIFYFISFKKKKNFLQSNFI